MNTANSIISRPTIVANTFFKNPLIYINYLNKNGLTNKYTKKDIFNFLFSNYYNKLFVCFAEMFELINAVVGRFMLVLSDLLAE